MHLTGIELQTPFLLCLRNVASQKREKWRKTIQQKFYENSWKTQVKFLLKFVELLHFHIVQVCVRVFMCYYQFMSKLFITFPYCIFFFLKYLQRFAQLRLFMSIQLPLIFMCILNNYSRNRFGCETQHKRQSVREFFSSSHNWIRLDGTVWEKKITSKLI